LFLDDTVLIVVPERFHRGLRQIQVIAVVNIVHVPILLVVLGIVLLLCHSGVVSVVHALDFGVLPIIRMLGSGFLTIVGSVAVVFVVVDVAVHSVFLVVNFVVVVVFVAVVLVGFVVAVFVEMLVDDDVALLVEHFVLELRYYVVEY